MPPFAILVYSVVKDSPDHVPEQCLVKGDESQARNTDELFHQCIRFQRALLYQKICYVCRAPDIINGHVGKCLGGEYCQQKRDGHHCKYVWIQCWGVGSKSVATVVKSNLYTTPETVIGHFTVPTEHCAWFVGMIAMSQRSAKFRELQNSVVKPMPT